MGLCTVQAVLSADASLYFHSIVGHFKEEQYTAPHRHRKMTKTTTGTTTTLKPYKLRLNRTNNEATLYFRFVKRASSASSPLRIPVPHQQLTAAIGSLSLSSSPSSATSNLPLPATSKEEESLWHRVLQSLPGSHTTITKSLQHSSLCGNLLALHEEEDDNNNSTHKKGYIVLGNNAGDYVTVSCFETTCPPPVSVVIDSEKEEEQLNGALLSENAFITIDFNALEEDFEVDVSYCIMHTDKIDALFDFVYELRCYDDIRDDGDTENAELICHAVISSPFKHMDLQDVHIELVADDHRLSDRRLAHNYDSDDETPSEAVPTRSKRRTGPPSENSKIHENSQDAWFNPGDIHDPSKLVKSQILSTLRSPTIFTTLFQKSISIPARQSIKVPLFRSKVGVRLSHTLQHPFHLYGTNGSRKIQIRNDTNMDLEHGKANFYHMVDGSRRLLWIYQCIIGSSTDTVYPTSKGTCVKTGSFEYIQHLDFDVGVNHDGNGGGVVIRRNFKRLVYVHAWNRRDGMNSVIFDPFFHLHFDSSNIKCVVYRDGYNSNDWQVLTLDGRKHRSHQHCTVEMKGGERCVIKIEEDFQKEKYIDVDNEKDISMQGIIILKHYVKESEESDRIVKVLEEIVKKKREIKKLKRMKKKVETKLKTVKAQIRKHIKHLICSGKLVRHVHYVVNGSMEEKFDCLIGILEGEIQFIRRRICDIRSHDIPSLIRSLSLSPPPSSTSLNDEQ